MHGVLSIFILGFLQKQALQRFQNKRPILWRWAALTWRSVSWRALRCCIYLPYGNVFLLYYKENNRPACSCKEEIEGLDINEHGGQAYPDFVTVDYTADDSESEASPAVTEMFLLTRQFQQK